MTARLANSHEEGAIGGSWADPQIGNLSTAIEQATNALHNKSPDFPVEFIFAWRDREATAHIDSGPDGTPVMSLRMKTGRMPFTAENSALRGQIGYLMQRPVAPQLGGFELGPQQTTWFVANVPLQAPVTGASIFTALTQTLLRVSPYLSLTTEVVGSHQN